ncbi:MAG: hypothetical protein ACOX4Y_01345 [Limnochordia bacterium]
MRIRLRYFISRFPSYAEIYISLIIMAAVVIGSIGGTGSLKWWK